MKRGQFAVAGSRVRPVADPVRQITNEIHGRIREYEQALTAARAFLAASPKMDRAAWRNYVTGLALPHSYPGISGIGFIEHVPADQLALFLTRTRMTDGSEFHVHPDGERASHMVIRLIEPMERNLRAVGYDIGSESYRRIAAEKAADSGLATLTGRIALVQDPFARSAVLLLLPFYRPGAPVATVEQRRAALVGWVYTPFRIEDAMAGIVLPDAPDVDFEVGRFEAALRDFLKRD